MQTLLYWVGKIIVLGIQSLPLGFVARAGRAFGALAYSTDGRHRGVALQNIRRCFPEKTEAEVEAIGRENFRRLGENYASAVKTAGMSLDDILARCEMTGLDNL